MVHFLCYFQKFQFLVTKKFEMIFAALYFYLNELKSVFQIFKISFQTGDIDIFVIRGVFSNEKKIKWWNLRHTLVQKLSNINMVKNQKKISSFAGVGALQSWMQNYTDNANEMYLWWNVSKMCGISNFLWGQGRHIFFCLFVCFFFFFFVSSFNKNYNYSLKI